MNTVANRGAHPDVAEHATTAPTRSARLSPAELESLARELDAIRDEVLNDLGERDVAHIRRIIRASHYSEAVGRLLIGVGLDPFSFGVGVSALSISKILENMEIGHNVMHGQYDWTGDPDLRSHDYEWDIVSVGDDWREYHNYEHHVFTNVLGKDRDIGYVFLRVFPEQPWRPHHLLQPLVTLGLAFNFQWGVAAHPLRIYETFAGEQSFAELRDRARPFLRKAAVQLAKDYVFYPALTPWNAGRVVVGNLLANGIRNLWTFGVIFCGHFPEGVEVYREEEMRSETRGEWYVRQIGGSANIEGSRTLHVLTGHLSHQIEHHLFPDIPASRYPEIAPRVREICRRYGLPYTSGRLGTQLRSVARSLLRLSIPGTS